MIGNYRDITDIPRYEQIAVDLATKIAQNEYKVGTKLYGRSTLAGQYNVSPETIRRAVALLQSIGIVEVVAGRGIMVVNRTAALKYLENFKHRRDIIQAQQEFSRLLEQRKEIDLAIENQMKKIMNFSSYISNVLPKVEEIKIKKGSSLAGKSLVSINFRGETDATVVAIEREGEEIFAPESSFVLKEGDILLYIGPDGSKEKVENFIKQRK